MLNETNVGIFTNDAVTKCLIFGYEIFIRFKAAAHYKISLRQDDYTDMWNITTFKITAVRHLEFFEVCILCNVTYPGSVLCCLMQNLIEIIQFAGDS